MKRKVINPPSDVKLYYLSESNDITSEGDAVRFVAKRYYKNGFQEFFGQINDPHFLFDSEFAPPKPVLLVSEDADDAYTRYGLNIAKHYKYGDKGIPIYIPKNFLALSPRKFGNLTRTTDEIAQFAAMRRNKIYKYYKKLHARFVGSLSEVQCHSIAHLYEYLNDGQKWEAGMEYYGYVDGLWETGSFLTVSIDTNNWSVRTAVHELGHSVSYYLSQDLFEEYYKIGIDKSERPVSEYGTSQLAEDFAESFACYFGLPKDKELLQNECTKRFDYMKKLDKIGPKALLDDLFASDALSKRFSRYDAVIWQ